MYANVSGASTGDRECARNDMAAGGKATKILFSAYHSPAEKVYSFPVFLAYTPNTSTAPFHAVIRVRLVESSTETYPSKPISRKTFINWSYKLLFTHIIYMRAAQTPV